MGDMVFQRARTDEQRTERRRQILDAAAAMLTEMPVAQLSLTALSRRVCLAKANVLRYFDSREAVLLELLEAEMADWIAELDRAETAGSGDRLAELLASTLTDRPVLCDLAGAQAAVLEHNISAETAIRHKYAAKQTLEELVGVITRHLPELGGDATAFVQMFLLTAIGTWPCSRPPEAVLSAYAADPELAALRIDFTDTVRKAAEVTVSGLLARRT
jgi:AcrR family transcriptional regulator